MEIDAQLPSSIATGDGGGHFEQHAGAFALSLLLTRAVPPILIDTSITEVHLQAQHLEWKTDDIVLVGKTSTGRRRTLACQAKRSFTVSSANAESVKTFQAMWDDFTSPTRFSEADDALALVTLHGTNVLLQSFTSLLDCARASTTDDDFRHRLAAGAVSKAAKKQHDEVQKIIERHVKVAPDPDTFWRFLRTIHVLSFDLNTPTAQTQAIAMSLLSQFSVDPSGAQDGSRDTWTRLLEITGRGRPIAESFTRQTLPRDLQERYDPIPTQASNDLRALVEHGAAIRSSIRSLIGNGYAINRADLEQELLEVLSTESVVLVAGTGGSGKSALAKKVLDELESDALIFAFSAVEFAVPHLDEALAKAQTTLNQRRLLALLAGQSRVYVLIESVERLLESSDRGAFTQLLDTCGHTTSVRLILTCRDYSVETVRGAFLDRAQTPHYQLRVGPLTDAELDQITGDIPSLDPPLRSPRLREFVRTPYLVDMASRLNWTESMTPASERAFRQKCWQELVRRDSDSSEGMPSRRETLFLDIAVSRAQQLRPFVQPANSDPAAHEALALDGIIQTSPDHPQLVAPSHDVLEDWAVVHWLNYHCSASDNDIRTLEPRIAGKPALRRGYRRWLSERFAEEPAATSRMVMQLVERAELPAYFRDDSLVSALMSAYAPGFLSESEDEFIGDDAAALVAVIRTLRVACQHHPAGPSESAVPSVGLVPAGSAWGPVVDLASKHIETLLPTHAAQILGLIEDWAKQVNWATPYPDGASSAGRIALALLPMFGDYGAEDSRSRILKVLLRIPRSIEADFEQLVLRAIDDDHRDRVASEFCDLLVGGVYGYFVCRDFPREVIRLTNAKMRISETPSQRSRDSDFDGILVDAHFGIQEHGRTDFFPASRIQGPFAALLRYHPRVGLDFILDLLNHAADWYANNRWPGRPLEPAWEIEISIPGEPTITQWMNPRFYGLYRGLSVGPYGLQSALMAMESWLLSLGDFEEVDLDRLLLRILRASNNAMATGVVASVCVAFPERTGTTGIAILSSRDLIECDLSRRVSEPQLGVAPFSGLNPEHQIFESERAESSKLPHRALDLENVAIRLQQTEHRDGVLRVIDRHREQLSSDDGVDNRTWRLALHRMDLRGYREVSSPETQPETGEEHEDQRRYFAPGELEPDLQEMVGRSSADAESLGRRLGLLSSDTQSYELRRHPLLRGVAVIEAAGWRSPGGRP